jgi:hypothetical protein
MKIATWNLESINRLTPDRGNAILGAMQEVNADVWVLTETWVGLDPLPGYELASQSCKANDLTPERCWVSIWVRSSLTSSALDINSRRQRERMAGVQIMNPHGGDFVVVGTVLPWSSDRLWPGAAGFCEALADQAAEWKRLQAIPEIGTFMVAGDFNQSLPNQLRYGSKQGATALSDTLRERDLFCLTPESDPLTAKPRIDHVCINRRGLQPPFLPQVGTWVVPPYRGKVVTDHAGAFADLGPLADQ